MKLKRLSFWGLLLPVAVWGTGCPDTTPDEPTPIPTSQPGTPTATPEAPTELPPTDVPTELPPTDVPTELPPTETPETPSETPTATPGPTPPIDADGDGFSPAGGDCNDNAPWVYPGATELCNEIDDDCDGEADEDALDPIDWYLDSDNDGYGDDDSLVTACEAPEGHVAMGGDCNDANPAFNPGAVEESCTDPTDYNCDGSTGYADQDQDGHPACQECDDTNPLAYPGAEERCDGADNNCDGSVDEASATDASSWYLDSDQDGYGDPASLELGCLAPEGYVADSTDCDDDTFSSHPGATERCNGQDDNCDGAVDEPTAADASTWYADTDQDGAGDPASSQPSCSQPEGFVADSTDCDDTSSAVHPLADEACNNLDDDCDGRVDEASAVDASTWYADADSDGFGDASLSQPACTQPDGYVDNSADCDDVNPATSPEGTEYCDGLDNNCNGNTDEASAVDASVWYADQDEDGFGAPLEVTVACYRPDGSVAVAEDCDDASSAVNPLAEERCDGIDNDCSGETDEPSAVDAATWYADTDGDGYGNGASSQDSCYQPVGYVVDATDCDDAVGSTHPLADEYCNGVDDDCDGEVDEASAVDAPSWYLDADGDGFGNPAVSQPSCPQPVGYVDNSLDCADDNVDTYPGADEYCDGLDNDCSSEIDEADALDATTWYLDADGDGYGGTATSQVACEAPAGYDIEKTDCNDANASISPAATEVCDGQDTNCDGTLPRLEKDPDKNGILACRQALWVNNGGAVQDDPTSTASNGGSEAGAIMKSLGLTWSSVRFSSARLTTSMLDNHGVLVLFGLGSDGTLTPTEASDLERWVRDGGGLLVMGYHDGYMGAFVNSLPATLGMRTGSTGVWSGTADKIGTHPTVAGCTTIGGAGGEGWVASGPMTTYASLGASPILMAGTLNGGRMVGFTDEWAFYNAASGTYSIGWGDHKKMVTNIFTWLKPL